MTDSDYIGTDFSVASFLDMLDSEHEDPVVSEVAHQDVSFVDSQEMCETNQPVSKRSIARYEMLISRSDIATAEEAFAISVIILSMRLMLAYYKGGLCRSCAIHARCVRYLC